ncbi:VP4 [Sulfolobus ellipsoid virus 1]|uniref:VP4 n=1 Tax=Sulfolobus ellipsoid virus 1 TaxID=2056194 RepID=A0A2H4RBN0_9VIRU|nr:VP4 [Sulfolobus ellipsoid virus 1]ATY46493.1 VP4 [Sulfolobus ellipsoid virus 1]
MARKKSVLKRMSRSPADVASNAWDKYLSKINQMIANYTSVMQNMPSNADAEARYEKGVATWTAIMRNPEVRNGIAGVVRNAKYTYEKTLMGVSSTGTVPITIPAQTG